MDLCASHMDHAKYLSRRGKRRGPSFIRQLSKYLDIPGMISLGGGLPPPELQPVSKITWDLDNGDQIVCGGKDLQMAMLYSPTVGKNELVKWVREYIIRAHFGGEESKYKSSICITNGSQDALQRAFDIILDEEDTLLVEQFTYSGALAALWPVGCRMAEVTADANGIVPDALEAMLSNWDVHTQGKKPKALYIIPTAQNPTGTTLSPERRMQVYAIAQKHDLIIFEDDPYWNVVFPNYPNFGKLNSLHSLDTDGRVIRFESFSKVMGIGLRVGWVVGHPQLIEPITFDLESGAQSASAAAQLEVLEILKKWGQAGWDSQVNRIQHFYQERAARIVDMIRRYVDGLVEFSEPTGSMFIWLKVKGIEDTKELVATLAVEHKILFVPGAAFSPNNQPSPYIRISYSLCPYDAMEDAIKRFGEVLRKLPPTL